MIRIGYVINYIRNGGPSNVIRNLIRCLDKNEYSITLITLFSGNDPAVVAELQGMNVKVIECKTLSRTGCFLGRTREFTSAINKGSFDVIHTHGLVPDILSSRLNTNANRISTVHNIMFQDYLEAYGKMKSGVFIRLHLHALRKLNVAVCCSKSVYDATAVHLNNAVFIRNGIGKTAAKTDITRKDLGIPNRSTVYIYVGQLRKRKNIVWLIKQFHQYHLPDEYLLVLGRGDEEYNCRKYEDANIRILGFTSDPISYLKLADVYLSASESEGFSIAVLEALDNGLALLVSDINPHKEVFHIHPELYIGEYFSPDQFEEKLNVLRTRVKQIDKKSIIAFKDQFLSAEEMTRQYCKLYEME